MVLRKLALLNDLKRYTKQVLEEFVVLRYIREDSVSVILLSDRIKAVLDDELKKHYKKYKRHLDIIKKKCHVVQKLKENINQRKLCGTNRIEREESWWISVAIATRTLPEIIRYFKSNSKKYYNEEAFMRDPEFCDLFLNLIEGPCSLEYAFASSYLRLYSDPHADELINMYCMDIDSPLSENKRYLIGGGSMEELERIQNCVESMHKTYRIGIIYGKNYVLLKNNGGDHSAGYFCIHHKEDDFFFNWTSNNALCDKKKLQTVALRNIAMSNIRTLFLIGRNCSGILMVQGTHGQILMELKFANISDAREAIESIEDASRGIYKVKIKEYFDFQEIIVGSPDGRIPSRTLESNYSVFLKNTSTEKILNDALKCIRMKILGRFFLEWKCHVKQFQKLRKLRYKLIICAPRLTNEGLTRGFWEENRKFPKDFNEIVTRVYWGGMDDSIRQEVWPYLLGLYRWDSSFDEKRNIKENFREDYTRKLGISLTAISNSCDCLTDKNESVSISQKWLTLPSFKRRSLNSLYEPSVTNHRRFSKSEELSINYTDIFVKSMAKNANKIKKDTIRCDRNYINDKSLFFGDENVKKLENMLLVYTIDKLQVGYVQGMCDLVAPFLVVLKDEIIAHKCFSLMMRQRGDNFPPKERMENYFNYLSVVTEIIDKEFYDYIIALNDGTEFYFCYRWFLLDFKREFSYQDIFKVWEVIWSAKQVCSDYFVVFLALALIQKHRNVIMHYKMGFADIIKFFNERAEKHNIEDVLDRARKLLEVIHNKIHDDE